MSVPLLFHGNLGRILRMGNNFRHGKVVIILKNKKQKQKTVVAFGGNTELTPAATAQHHQFDLFICSLVSCTTVFDTYNTPFPALRASVTTANAHLPHTPWYVRMCCRILLYRPSFACFSHAWACFWTTNLTDECIPAVRIKRIWGMNRWLTGDVDTIGNKSQWIMHTPCIGVQGLGLRINRSCIFSFCRHKISRWWQC